MWDEIYQFLKIHLFQGSTKDLSKYLWFNWLQQIVEDAANKSFSDVLEHNFVRRLTLTLEEHWLTTR